MEDYLEHLEDMASDDSLPYDHDKEVCAMAFAEITDARKRLAATTLLRGLLNADTAHPMSAEVDNLLSYIEGKSQ